MNEKALLVCYACGEKWVEEHPEAAKRLLAAKYGPQGHKPDEDVAILLCPSIRQVPLIKLAKVLATSLPTESCDLCGTGPLYVDPSSQWFLDLRAS